MKRSFPIVCAVLFILAVLTSGCSGQKENSAASNSNDASNSNSAEVAPSNAAPVPSAGTPLAVQQIPPPPPKAADSPAKPADKPETAAASSVGARAPKLVAPEKRIDFGKQPPDKKVVRAITIRNSGKADLKIESIVPG